MLPALLLVLALPAAAASDRLSAALDRATGTNIFDYAVLYQSCRAYAAAEPQQCDALKPYKVTTRYQDPAKKELKRPDSYDFLCRSNVFDLRMSAAAIRGQPERFAEACEGHDAAGHDDFLPGKVKEGCALMGRLGQDPSKTCKQLAPLMKRQSGQGYCESELNVFNGRPESCGQPGLGPVGQEVCRANVAYRRAELAKDPSLCGDSAFCRAHAGGGSAACEPYLEHAERLACRAKGPGACKPSAIDKARLAEADALLRQSGAILDVLEKGSCGSGFSVETLSRTLAEKRLPDDLSDALFQATRGDLENLYQCRAIVQGSDKICGELDGMPGLIQREANAEPLPMGLMCRTLYYEAAMAVEVMGSDWDEVRKLCVARNKVGDRDFKLDSLEVSCGILSGYRGDTAATCGKLTSYFDNATIEASCPRMLRYAAGDATICPEFRDPLVHERCLGYAAYKKKDCGGSNYCRTLKGETSSCKVYEKGIAGSYCRFYDQVGPRLPALFSRIDVILGENDPAGATGARGAALSALRQRLGSRKISRAP